MKNLLKFILFVLLVSAGISALYDYRIKTGGLRLLAVAPEKYSLATGPSVDPKQVTGLEALNRERRALVSSVIPSVVSIKTSKKVAVRRQYQLDPSDFFNRNPRQFRNPNEEAMVQNSLGSGVVVTAEGHIITNNHVVDQVDEIEIQLSDGKTKKAKLIGADAVVDLAVLKIDEPGLKPLKFGDSDAVQAGDFVVAIGNPFGFEETVTDGIISSKGRPNRVDGFGDYLQTNAAINPGNSGGPLVNLQGEIIGINTAIISRSGGSQGIGFAIPSNSVKTALESLLKNGRIIRGYLGIQARPTTQGVAETDGVIVDDVVPNSPASEAKLKRDDVIKKFNGHNVRNIAELRSLVAQVELNKKVEMEVLRAGNNLKVMAEIKEQPADYLTSRNNPRQPQTPQAPDDQQENGENSALGSVEVSEVTPEVVRQLDLPNRIRGVVVTKLDGEVGELRAGDVIEEINQQPVTSVAEYKRIVSTLDPNGTAVLSVCRHRTRSFVVLRPR
ncbi:MAG TPA: trypsin-like peptidase domain-containing protein [Chthoniobacterales bacterium]|jgi:serine protease Do|nr:trypsin-like peptidase domain-containing protein [Chthoniobacterales bacterium]